MGVTPGKCAVCTHSEAAESISASCARPPRGLVERVARCDVSVQAYDKCEPIECLIHTMLGDEDWTEEARGLCFRILALEFDRVLTMQAVDETVPPEMSASMFGSQERVKALQGLLSAARQHGCTVLVISWANSDFISGSLESVQLQSCIDQIFDRTWLEKTTPQDANKDKCKGLLMQEILRKLGVPAARTVFVDRRLQCLENGRMPCRAHHVEGGEGMEQIDLENICTLLGINAGQSQQQEAAVATRSTQPTADKSQTVVEAEPPLDLLSDPVNGNPLESQLDLLS